MIIKMSLHLIGSLVGSIAFGFVAGYVAVSVLPCEWFGSNFEGACGYGAMLASFGIGLAAAMISFGMLSYRAISNVIQRPTIFGIVDPSLFKLWVVTLVILIGSLLIPLLEMRDVIDATVSGLSIAAFYIMSFIVLRRLKLSYFLLLISLVPFVGIVVFVVLIVRAYKAQIPSSS